MLQLVYIIAFTALAFLAIYNLIRNLMMLGSDARRPVNRGPRGMSQQDLANAHPELLDEDGKVVREPYLVMRSVSMEDARERLDALYDSSPGVTDNSQDETAE